MKRLNQSPQVRGRQPADLAGRTFGRLTVHKYAGRDSKHRFWKCRCSCGRKTVSRTDALIGGKANSCGCLNIEHIKVVATTHGKHRTPEYRAWNGMLYRCTNPRSKSFKDYGGRGIVVCERWRHSFENFYADMGQRPSKKHSIDRKDNDGNYEPGNCRWATRSAQNSNRRILPRRNARVISHAGQRLTISQWANLAGMSYAVLNQRLHKGMGFADAISTPVNSHHR